MSEEYMYTSGDILIEPYKFQKITKLKVVRELNEHAKLYISGIISDENVDKYVEEAGADETIKVSAKDDQENIINLFEGILTKVRIKAKNDVRTLEIEALSKTFLMDIRKNNGSFQDPNLTYSDIFNQKNSGYGDVVMVDNITNETKIDKFIVQYKETDWTFLKRLASHFNVALVPECRLSGIKYSIGGAGQIVVYDIDEFNYSIEKGLQEYNLKSSNEGYELNDVNLISYEVITNKILGLYSEVNFKGKKLLVYKCEIELVGGILSNKYVLRDETGMKVKKVYNNNIVGVSLQGRILATEKDRVKVSLELDGSPTERDGTRWFEFATIFSQPNGTGWYCMPEIEDIVRLYFPDNEEKNAYVISSMHYEGIDDSKRSDPSVKSISTKYGKEIVMSPGSVEIIGNGNLLMKMTDDGGIELNSNKKIILDAKGDIEINSGSKVQIKGYKGISLTQAGASMTIKDDVTISGGKVNVQN
ncbi:phage tail protein [Clostridium weizhouense]|uniref:Phage tail protein n=1 Tax=Clostridium weizhouense TaxID=2859781 RepID=A0ABS7ANT8_9CLOT|nr:phage tail protein [Clostridium weizhouense]MBW6410330.1 phage tail protein [Clostridium weizhouense]